MSLNKLQMERVKSYLQNSSLFQEIIMRYVENQDLNSLVKLLETNHSANKSILADLGVEFKDTDTIRRLNQEIRSLEKEKGSTELDFSAIASYLKVKKDNLRNHLEEHGISGSLEFNMSSCLDIKLKLYSQHKTPMSKLKDFRSEEDFDSYMEKEKKELDYFLTNYSTLECDHGSYYLDNSKENIDKIKSLLEAFFNSSLNNFKYTIGWTVPANDDEPNKRKREQVLTLSEISFTVLFSAGDRALSALFKAM